MKNDCIEKEKKQIAESEQIAIFQSIINTTTNTLVLFVL
jgi:hypothetical protein